MAEVLRRSQVMGPFHFCSPGQVPSLHYATESSGQHSEVLSIAQMRKLKFGEVKEPPLKSRGLTHPLHHLAFMGHLCWVMGRRGPALGKHKVLLERQAQGCCSVKAPSVCSGLAQGHGDMLPWDVPRSSAEPNNLKRKTIGSFF